MSAPDYENSTFMAGRNINGYYTFHFFINFAFWLPIYAIFFLDRGLEFSAILIVYAVVNGVQTLLELPSGVLADRWGRKPVLMLGALIQAAGYMFFNFGTGMPWYLLGAACLGTAMAFLSGSDAAFIYDSLMAAGRQDEFKRIEGRAYMYNLIGWGAGGLLGGYLAAESLQLPYILSSITSIMALLVLGLCEEPPRAGKAAQGWGLFKQAVTIARSNASVRTTIIFGALIFGLLLVTHKFSQPYLLRAGLELKVFGLIYFVWLMCAAASSYYSEAIERLLGRTGYYLLVPVVTGAAVVYLGVWQNMLGVAIALAYQVTWGSLRPQMNQIINREVDSSLRATVLSASGFGSSIIYIAAAPIIGGLADAYDFPLALQVLGVAIAILGLLAALGVIRAERAGDTAAVS